MSDKAQGKVECFIRHETTPRSRNRIRPCKSQYQMLLSRVHNSYRVKSKWIRFVKCHSFSGEHREVRLRTTEDHTVDTFTTTLTNFTIMKMGKQSRGEGKGERKRRGGKEFMIEIFTISCQKSPSPI